MPIPTSTSSTNKVNFVLYFAGKGIKIDPLQLQSGQDKAAFFSVMAAVASIQKAEILRSQVSTLLETLAKKHKIAVAQAKKASKKAGGSSVANDLPRASTNTPAAAMDRSDLLQSMGIEKLEVLLVQIDLELTRINSQLDTVATQQVLIATVAAAQQAAVAMQQQQAPSPGSPVQQVQAIVVSSPEAILARAEQASEKHNTVADELTSMSELFATPSITPSQVKIARVLGNRLRGKKSGFVPVTEERQAELRTESSRYMDLGEQVYGYYQAALAAKQAPMPGGSVRLEEESVLPRGITVSAGGGGR